MGGKAFPLSRTDFFYVVINNNNYNNNDNGNNNNINNNIDNIKIIITMRVRIANDNYYYYYGTYTLRHVLFARRAWPWCLVFHRLYEEDLLRRSIVVFHDDFY